MTTGTLTPAKTSLSRVFVVEGRARADHNPSYESCLRLTAISQGFGDITKIECPDPNNYGKFIEIGQIKGATERVKTSLEGRYALDLKSKLMRLARNGCPIDVQVHLGACEDPRNFNTFQKAIILEDVRLTSVGTEDLGALASGDDKGINETADISARGFYEVVPLAFAEKAASIVTNEILDIVLCDNISCGECSQESDGCKKVIAISKLAGGSPASPADVVFTKDGGTTWFAYDINSLSAAQDPSHIDCIGSYVVIVSFALGGLVYALKSQFTGYPAPSFTNNTTGFIGKPKHIKSFGSGAFIVGEQGYIYLCTDPTLGVTVLDAGGATPNMLNWCDALSGTFAVAVGGNSTIVMTNNGSTWVSIPAPTGAGINYNTVMVKSENEWWIGTSNGYLYYTLDGGTTWSISDFPGSRSGVVRDIVDASDSVYYMAHDTAAVSGRILRSFDGGHSWIVLPELTGSLIKNDRINAIAVCSNDVNLVFAGGLHDNGTDGIILVGSGG